MVADMREQIPNRQVGLIGVGTMGRAILNRLIDGGIQVYAYDPSPAASEAILFSGGISCSISDISTCCRIIFLVLPGPVQVLQVMDEILDSEPQSGTIVCDFTTSTPYVTHSIEQRCEQIGIHFLDTPILGRPSLVGRWCLPVGGSEEALDRVTPLLKSIAGKIYRVGETGAGHTLKLLNQLMFNVTNAMVVEMFTVASQSGIDPKIIYEVIADSGAATVSGLFKEVGRKIVEGDFSPLFSIDLLIKDAQLSLDMADSWGLTPALGKLAQEFNLRARDLGLGAEDTSALIKIFD